jgi:hypothetical protein
MKTTDWLVPGVLVFPLLFAGCTGNSSNDAVGKPDAMQGKVASVNPESRSREDKDNVQAAPAQLSADDQQLAQAQRFCPKSGKPLGSMGVPIKVMLKGQPVFLCCEGCEKDAREHPDQMLAKAEELKAKAKSSPAGK